MTGFAKIVMTVLLIFIGVIAVVYGYFKWEGHRRMHIVQHVIVALDGYQKLHGRYPQSLPDSIERGAFWLYYSCDSVGSSYYVAFVQGPMDSNTWRYESRHGKWQQLFNY